MHKALTSLPLHSDFLFFEHARKSTDKYFAPMQRKRQTALLIFHYCTQSRGSTLSIATTGWTTEVPEFDSRKAL
jgi:hypothetical protein